MAAYNRAKGFAIPLRDIFYYQLRILAKAAAFFSGTRFDN